jgi:hypothetical protein
MNVKSTFQLSSLLMDLLTENKKDIPLGCPYMLEAYLEYMFTVKVERHNYRVSIPV